MEYVSIEVHNEFAARMKEENDRQNHRISSLEDGQKQINELISSVKVLAVNMEKAKQGERLEAIEQKPAKHWDTVIACLITGIVGAVLTAAISGIFH